MKNNKTVETIDSFPSIFDEEFDPNLVVNRSKHSDFLEDDLLAQEEKQNKETKSFYISHKDLANILSENPGLNLQTKTRDGLLVEINNTSQLLDANLDYNENLIEITIPSSSVSKPSDAQTIRNQFDEFDFDDENYNISEDELAELARKENLKQKLFEENKKFKEESYVLPQDKFFEQRKISFLDYVSANVISGNKVKKYSDTYIPEEFVPDVEPKKLEIIDLNSFAGKEIKKTSVLINRDENGEIDSLEVLCKCGERTLIKFDFDENDQEAVSNVTKNTLVVVDTLPEKPLDIMEATRQASKNREKNLKENSLVKDITSDFNKLYEDNDEELYQDSSSEDGGTIKAE